MKIDRLCTDIRRKIDASTDDFVSGHRNWVGSVGRVDTERDVVIDGDLTPPVPRGNIRVCFAPASRLSIAKPFERRETVLHSKFEWTTCGGIRTGLISDSNCRGLQKGRGRNHTLWL